MTGWLCRIARISLFHGTTFAAWLQVWREEHGRIFVLSVDDAHDARVLMDYFPGTEEQEVVYNVRLRLCVCAVQRFHSLDVCRVLASPCFACLPRGPQTGPSLEKGARLARKLRPPTTFGHAVFGTAGRSALGNDASLDDACAHRCHTCTQRPVAEVQWRLRSRTAAHLGAVLADPQITQSI